MKKNREKDVVKKRGKGWREKAREKDGVKKRGKDEKEIKSEGKDDMKNNRLVELEKNRKMMSEEKTRGKNRADQILS